MAHTWRRPLNESSGWLLRTAREELVAEWAAAGGLSVVAAQQEVDDLLREGKDKYGK
jgi:hypothetical protein